MANDRQPAKRTQATKKRSTPDPLASLVATAPIELVRRYGRPEIRRLMAHLRVALGTELAAPTSGCPHPRDKRRIIGANAKNPGYAAVCEACGAIL